MKMEIKMEKATVWDLQAARSMPIVPKGTELNYLYHAPNFKKTILEDKFE